MFGFLKKRAEKRERKAELNQLARNAAEEVNDAIDEYFIRVEDVSQDFLEKLNEYLQDLGPIEDETPREMAEMWLLEVVGMWREVRPAMEAASREALTEQFEVTREIGVDWRLEEILTERFEKAEFNFKARAVIAAGEAADAAEGNASA